MRERETEGIIGTAGKMETDGTIGPQGKRKTDRGRRGRGGGARETERKKID